MKISAVVPTFDEKNYLPGCLRSLRDAGVGEILVVDGGSRDGTQALAARGADRVFVESAGLFAQLNRGALEARGDVILFQYADGLFPASGVADLEHGLADSAVVGGSFALRYASVLRAYRIVERGASIRNFLGLGPFGDQSLFVRAKVFRELGGFDDGAFFPDHDLVRKLRRRGRFRRLNTAVTTSTRRHERDGFLRTLWNHWKLSASYLAGRGAASEAASRLRDDLRKTR